MKKTRHIQGMACDEGTRRQMKIGRGTRVRESKEGRGSSGNLRKSEMITMRSG